MTLARRLDPAGLQNPRRYLDRRLWDLERFGLTPKKIALRISGSPAPPVVFTSIPKAGTHLTERLLCLHPHYYRTVVPTISSPALLTQHAASLSNGQLLCAHVQYSEAVDSLLRELGIKLILSIRDPRDILISRAHYIYNTRDHYLHHLALRYPDLRDRITVLIEGEPTSGLVPYREVLHGFAGWLSRDIILIRFEDLVDPHRRPQVVADVFEDLGTPVDRSKRDRIAASTASSTSPTFRRGQAGEWRRVFDERLHKLFHEAVGDMLPALGYSDADADAIGTRSQATDKPRGNP